MNKTGLSIVIPTFNREDQLKNQLKLIFSSDINLVEEIIVIDNHSEYDVAKLLETFNSNKIRLITHPFNIKVHNNIAFAFYYVQTEWFWLLSDDDEVEKDAIRKIKEEIEEVSSNTGMIKFARANSPQQNFIANNLEDFIDYYYNENNIRSGDLVFISTNIYNISRIKEYLGLAFEYAYTYVPHIIPIIKGLENHTISIKFTDKTIVKYVPPREGNYSFATVGKGLSTLTHIPMRLSKKYRKRFFYIIMSINYQTMINWSIKHDCVEELKIIYNNIYKQYIRLHEKAIVKIFILFMSYRLTKKFVLKIHKIYKFSFFQTKSN